MGLVAGLNTAIFYAQCDLAYRRICMHNGWDWRPDDLSPHITGMEKTDRRYALEVIDNSDTEGMQFNRRDIVMNIAAAVNHFGIGNNGDIDVIRTQIAAILYIAGLADADKVFNALNKDSTAYATVNERVRMYTGEAMDERLIEMDIDKDTGDAVLEKLRLFTDWELEYLTERICPADEDGLPGSIKEAHINIMNCLHGQGKRDKDVPEAIAAGGDEDV